MKNKNKECEGCQALCEIKLSNYPIYKNFKEEVIAICPCITCLVKVTCKDICEDYAKFELKRHEIKGIKRSNPYRRINQGTHVSTFSLCKDNLK